MSSRASSAISQRCFSPAEVATRLGVTVRALRIYERHRLIKPLRTSAGWRAYGPDQMARLHQILALKGLGLSLARIADLLDGRLKDLDAVLKLQEDALRGRRRQVEHALDLVATARRRLADGAVLSLDDITQLTRETTMTAKIDETAMKEIFDPLIEKHFTPEELDKAKARKFDLMAANGFDPAQFQSAWDVLVADAARLMALGDPASPAAKDLLRRWNAEVERFTGGDPALRAKSAAMWKDAMSDPAATARMPFKPEMFAFLGEVGRLEREAQA
jgi:DNA-binding transcriptional MerR regulator